jgi:hypothetical protein
MRVLCLSWTLENKKWESKLKRNRGFEVRIMLIEKTLFLEIYRF